MQQDPFKKQLENSNFSELKPKNAFEYDVKSILPTRLNFILGVAATLLSIIVVQLAILQIVNGTNFKTEVSRSDNTVQTTKVPRGLIYDSTGRVTVGNATDTAITFTRSLNATQNSIYKTAVKIGKLLKVNTDKLTERSIADYWLMDKNNKKKVDTDANISTSVTSTNYLDVINAKEIAYLKDHKPDLNDDQKNDAMIFQLMSSAYQLSTTSIKDKDVSEEELAKVGEKLSEMPGIQIGSAWSRTYPQGDGVKSLMGRVTSPSTGLPIEQLKSLLAQGYAQNESIGISGIEGEYEATLRGSNKKTQLTLSTNNSITKTDTLYEGAAGNNLNLTINAEFQNEVQNILHANMPGGLTTGGYAAVINPQTGALYAVAGVDRNNKTGELTDNALGAVQNPIIMGSAVKPAMVSAALQAGVITPTNNTLNDMVIKVAGTKDKTSYFNQSGTPIPLTAQNALEVSSNTYMMQLALLMNGTPYSEGMSIPIKDGIWDQLRNGFGQFGLGYRTGVDIPNETPGFKGPTLGNENAGKILDESFGNYDSYSVIQMARYVSAIANGGYLMKPYLVKSISTTGTNNQNNKLIWSNKAEIQGKVDLDNDQWKVIREGMYAVGNGNLEGNTGGTSLHELEPKVAAKSGTAETFTDKVETTTASLILYVPGQPVALALAFPGVTPGQFNVNVRTGHDIMEAFYQYVMDKPSEDKTPTAVLSPKNN